MDNLMEEHFFQGRAVATCSALSQQARSTAIKLHQVLSTGSVKDDGLLKQLGLLSARLPLFRQHADQLGHCIADTPVVLDDLGSVLISSLAECQNAFGTIADRLEPGSGGLTSEAIACYESLLNANARLFVFLTQLLVMEIEEEQRSKLSSHEARTIVDAAHNASLAVISFEYATEN
ncbi:hypothetical protein VTI74DRAFT_2621 [Chaetomium olivicolor]